ncbi:hypothetical protein AZE42_05966 [Rhizopogon vesiculosus]|uniref:Uncharacterized protein n=1 Tax=Rhizopogon vesiculosus TaxID=180088 RepID=A0A1J8PTE7_9AGAM|nr:hypothetical protein AZE42_05966 [Rhizopogon vesiculosus]
MSTAPSSVPPTCFVAGDIVTFDSDEYSTKLAPSPKKVGTFAVLIFDYCITLEAEVFKVGLASEMDVRAVYIHHIAVLAIGMTFVAALRTQYYPGESCVRYGTASNVLHILCIIAAEGLLIIRIYAAWNSKRLLIFLLVFPILCFITSYIISDTPLVFNSTNTTPITIRQRIRVTVYCWVSYHISQDFWSSSRMHELHGFLSQIREFNLNSHNTTAHASHISSPQIVMHSVLASRILFNLRASEGCSGTHHTLEALTDIQFEGGQCSTLIYEV